MKLYMLLFTKGGRGRVDKKEEIRIVKKAIKGKPDAYGQLISEYQKYLYRVAFLYMKNEQEALDIVGDTILKGFQNISTLKNPEWFRTWITRVLINVANDKKKKIVSYVDFSEELTSSKADGVSIEERCDLNSAIQELPDKYRTVIILKYFSEFSIKEIAYTMNSPEGTIKAYLSRARDELKKILKEDYMHASEI